MMVHGAGADITTPPLGIGEHKEKRLEQYLQVQKIKFHILSLGGSVEDLNNFTLSFSQ
jgi:hypothetical protein